MPDGSSVAPTAPWRIALFGELSAERECFSIRNFRTRKTAALLAYLAYYPRQTHLRDALTELLWPGVEPRLARHNLSNALSALRCCLEPPDVERGAVLVVDRYRLHLNPEAVRTDLADFEAALRSAARAPGASERVAFLARAVESYRAPLLEGCEEAWVLREREVLAEQYFQALHALLVCLEEAARRGDGGLERALEYARWGVAMDPLREAPCRDLMRLLAATGQPEAALRQYRALEQRLADELASPPAAATVALAGEIEQRLRSPALPGVPISPAPGTASADERRVSNLPAPSTPLLGREREVAAAGARLRRPEVRLVTLTGTGGVGKTRLALQVAAEVADAFAGGVFLVLLAPIRDPELIDATIAAVLGVREQGDRPLREALEGYLRDRELLLLLDNFEQLLAGAGRLAELLAVAPRLKLLVTSRAVLRLRGEHEFVVPPLALPEGEGAVSAAAIGPSPAVALFAQRAAAVRSGFAVTDENAGAVASICRRLEGLPLSIELAAARVKLFAPEALLSRLERRLPLLTSGARDAPARQQTLRDTIQWSYDLLSESEQRLFRRLAVFVGGFTLEAAEAVGGEALLVVGCSLLVQDDPPTPEPTTNNQQPTTPLAVLDGLALLVDQSLLQQEAGVGGEARFGMLETIREYGLECLAAGDEEPVIRQRHARFFLGLTAQAGYHCADRSAWLKRLEREHDNFRAALEWGLAADGERETGLQLAGALGWFWNFRAHWAEGRRWLAAALERSDPQSRTAARARALHAAGVLAFNQDDLAAARSLSEESAAIWRELGDRSNLAQSLTHMGWAAIYQEDAAAARAALEESAAIARDTGERWIQVPILNGLRWVAQAQGDMAAARLLSQESVTLARELEDGLLMTWSLGGMGELALAQSDYAAARSTQEECLLWARKAEHHGQLSVSLYQLLHVALCQGDYTRARSLGEERLAIERSLGAPRAVAHALCALGHVACAEGDLERAEALLEESLSLLRGVDDRQGSARSLMHRAQVACARGDLDRAEGLAGESLRLWRASGDTAGLAGALAVQGWVMQARGRAASAAALHRQSLDLRRKLEDRRGMAESLEALAAVSGSQGEPERAARLLAAAAAVREALGTPVLPVHRAWNDACLAAVRAALGEEGFAAAWAEGQAMTAEQAVLYALEEAPDA